MRYAAAIGALLLSTLILVTNQLAQPPDAGSLRPKVFVIGLSKTGTTSIGDALHLLGYRRLGWRDILSRHMSHSWANGHHDTLIEQSRYYDAFEDLPWPFMFRQMAEMYPDAKFVLSLRKDEQTWLRSMRRHVDRGRWLPHRYFYGTDRVEGHEDVVLQSYRNHTAHVREYFRDQPHRYVELSIDDGDANWDVLCRVAKCPHGRRPSASFPRANTAADWKQGLLADLVQFCWGWIVTRTEELCAVWYFQAQYPVVQFFLSSCWHIMSTVDHACSRLSLLVSTALNSRPALFFLGERRDVLEMARAISRPN